MKIRAILVIGAVAAGALLGCGGKGKGKSADDVDTSGDGSDASEPGDGATEGDGSSDGSGTSEGGPSEGGSEGGEDAQKSHVVGTTTDYELTGNDCQALADVYAAAWEKEEIKKLNAKGLPEKQFKAAEAEVASGKENMHSNWLNECMKTVGSAYLYENLQCAVKAKTLDRFNDCWDGKVKKGE